MLFCVLLLLFTFFLAYFQYIGDDVPSGYWCFYYGNICCFFRVCCQFCLFLFYIIVFILFFFIGFSDDMFSIMIEATFLQAIPIFPRNCFVVESCGRVCDISISFFKTPFYFKGIMFSLCRY